MTIKLRRPPDPPTPQDLAEMPTSVRDFVLDANRWMVEVWKQLYTEGALSHLILGDIGTNTHDDIDEFISLQTSVTITAADLTLDETNKHVEATAVLTLTLPDATEYDGETFILDNNHSGVTTVLSDGGTIENEVSQTITGQAAMVVYSDGTNWRIK